MPLRLKFALGLLGIQISFALVMLVLGFVMVSHKAESEFWRGFQEALAVNAGAASLDEYGPYHAGRHTFAMMLPLVFGALGVAGIIGRKYGLTIGVTIAGGVLALAQGGLPLIPVAVLFLVVSGSAKTWLQSRSNQPPLGPSSTPPPLPQ